jgi:hypothetical protein
MGKHTVGWIGSCATDNVLGMGWQRLLMQGQGLQALEMPMLGKD